MVDPSGPVCMVGMAWELLIPGISASAVRQAAGEQVSISLRRRHERVHHAGQVIRDFEKFLVARAASRSGGGFEFIP